MMSTRGVRFRFVEGQKVLCFEPDPKKAKVLYESKVLQLVVSRDSRGRKIAEYLVHFYGWNSSWDRCVAEDFILPDNDENRSLQKRLSQEAAIQLMSPRKGKKRHKLTSLLKGSYNPCKKSNIEQERREACAARSDDESQHTDSSNDDDDDDESQEENGNTNEDEIEDADDGIDLNQSEIDDDVNVVIPTALKEKLEDDCFMITCKNKLINLPCEPNVISILEGYVKHVAVSLVCTSPIKGTRQQFSLSRSFTPDVEQKILLCKEVVDGLRIYFDFCLPVLLLYRHEKTQFDSIDSIKVSVIGIKKSNDSTVLESKHEETTEPPLLSSISGTSLLNLSPRSTRQSRAAVRPSSPLFNSPIKTTAQQYRKRSQSPNSSGEEAQTSRRVLRSTDKSRICSELKIETTPADQGDSCELASSVSSPDSPTLPQKILRHTLKSLSPSSAIAESLKSPSSAATHQNRSKTDVQPPLAVNQTSVSSVGSSASSTHSSVASSGDGGTDSSGLLSEVLSWQMLPEHLYEQVPPLPSMVYGAHHLLRLFVKLPALVQKMNIPKNRQDHLQKELQNFISYMHEKSDELLLDSVYINNKDQTGF